MFSYQQEFKDDLRAIVNAISLYKGSQEYKDLLTFKSYYMGDNEFIREYKKKVFDDKEERLVDNVYAPNFKTKYNFFADMVSQKVNSLLTETPIVNGLDEKTSKDLGYTLLNAAKEASVCGYSFIFTGMNKFTPFRTEQCMAYVDDNDTSKIMRFIRFWTRKINMIDFTYFELYDESGWTTYKIENGVAVETIKKQFYLQIVQSSAVSTNVKNVPFEYVPIVILKNNKDSLTDLAPNIKSKIDLIDLVESGFVNNIEEFSDVWMTINAPGATEEDAQKIKETVRRTKAVIFANSADKNSVGFSTMEIPYQARQTAVSMLKEELIEDAGVIDFKDIKGAATNVHIEARLLKLKQKVSEFEWYVDDTATKIIELWQIYNDKNFDISISFQKLYIKNNQETVNIANSIYDKVSLRTYLNLLKEAGIVEDVDAEIEAINAESVSKFNLLGDAYGQSTQPDGQVAEPNEQDFAE